MTHDAIDVVREKLAAAAAHNKEQLAAKMLAAGQTTEKGWTIGEEIVRDEFTVTHKCWPVPPKDYVANPRGRPSNE